MGFDEFIEHTLAAGFRNLVYFVGNRRGRSIQARNYSNNLVADVDGWESSKPDCSLVRAIMLLVL